MPDFGGLSAISEAFAAAALDPSLWNGAMDAAAKATNSFGAILVPATGGPLPSFPFSERMPASIESYVQKGWIHRDIRYEAFFAFLHRGAVAESDFISPEKISRHPYYQEFLEPHKLRWFAGVRIGDGPDIWCLSLQRGIADGPFAPGELRRLAGLSRRLAGAAELARALGFARTEAAAQAFETSGAAVAMIDRAGEVVRLNPSAERLLGPDLQIVRRRIASPDRAAAAALDKALHGLVWSREGEPLCPPIVLPRREGQPILAYPSRLPRAATESFALCHGVVVFVDLAARPSAPARDLARVFGLTPAEARLANALLSGDSIEAAADKLGVAYETARNLLKSVFQKTGTHRQGQLIALLARLARRAVVSAAQGNG